MFRLFECLESEKKMRASGYQRAHNDEAAPGRPLLTKQSNRRPKEDTSPCARERGRNTSAASSVAPCVWAFSPPG